MLNLARIYEQQEAWLTFGNVENIKNNQYIVLAGANKITAVLSQGCLIKPEIGDRVLAAVSGPEAYVLEVLKKEQTDRPIPMVINGDTNLTVKGRLNLTAQNLDLTGQEQLTIKTAKIKTDCLEGQIRFNQLSIIGGTMTRRLKNLKTTVKNMETEAERVLARFQRHYQRITDFQDNRLGRAITWVKTSFNLNTQKTSIQAEENVNIDAKQIHLG